MPLRILVVDDNRDTLRIYERAILRKITPNRLQDSIPVRPGVETADDVSTALDKLRAQRFDLLVVDLKIPGLSGQEMGGLDVISQSLQLDPLRPVIVITGWGTVELAKTTLTQGVFDFIEKGPSAVEDLVDAINRALDRMDEKIKRSGNPFTPMTGAEPVVFGGRTAELEFFEQRLHRALHNGLSEHFLVLGDWGIGKSTLLKEYKKMCQSRGHLASIVPLEPLQPGTKAAEAARSMVEGILRDLPYPVDRFKKVLQFFGSIGISVFGTGLTFARATSPESLSTQAFLHDTLLNLWQDVESSTDVFVVLLDDLGNFKAVSEIVMTLRQTLSMDAVRKTGILFGMASTPANWKELTSLEQHHPLSRFFLSRVELAPLSEDELRDTILNSLVRTGVSFSNEVTARVFEYTEGHPFEMQVLCHHLFNNQLSRQVTEEVWEKSLQAALSDLGVAIFDYWFGLASGEEAKVLRIIAEADTPISIREIQERAAAGKTRVSAQNVGKFLERLIEKKLIQRKARGLYAVPDAMFRAYIRTQSD